MKILEKCERLLKLSFFVGLGGVSAIAGSCGSSQRTDDDADQLRDVGQGDTGSQDTGSQDTGSQDTGSQDTGNQDAGAPDTSADADAEGDGSSDADMWDVVYE